MMLKWKGKEYTCTCSPVKVANVGCGLWVVVQVYIGIDGRWWEGAWRMERGRGGLTWEASSIHNSSHCHPAQKGYTPTFKISYKYNLRWTCAFSFPSLLVSITCPDLQEKFPYHQTQNQIFCLNHVDENAFSCFSKIVPKQINHLTDNLGGTICHVTLRNFCSRNCTFGGTSKTAGNQITLLFEGSCLAVDQTVMELRRVNNNLEGIKSLLTVSFFLINKSSNSWIYLQVIGEKKSIYPTSGTPGGWKGCTCKYCILGSCWLGRG